MKANKKEYMQGEKGELRKEILEKFNYVKSILELEIKNNPEQKKELIESYNKYISYLCRLLKAQRKGV